MNILVTGGTGLLGSHIKKLSNNINDIFYFPLHSEFDLTSYDIMADYIDDKRIEVIINCAAYTDVTSSEYLSNQKPVNINCLGVENLVAVCKIYGIKLVHISTDYVFNSDSLSKLFQEVDIPNPKNRYGLTKLYGEKIIENNLPRNSYLIIRTSWLYDKSRGFIPRMISKYQQGEIFVVTNEVGTPTYAGDLAKAIVNNLGKMFTNTTSGLYHFTNCISYTISRYELVVKAYQLLGFDTSLINPISADKYSIRPTNSGLNNNKFQRDFNYKIPDWTESLKSCLIN